MAAQLATATITGHRAQLHSVGRQPCFRAISVVDATDRMPKLLVMRTAKPGIYKI